MAACRTEGGQRIGAAPSTTSHPPAQQVSPGTALPANPFLAAPRSMASRISIRTIGHVSLPGTAGNLPHRPRAMPGVSGPVNIMAMASTSPDYMWTRSPVVCAMWTCGTVGSNRWLARTLPGVPPIDTRTVDDALDTTFNDPAPKSNPSCAANCTPTGGATFHRSRPTITESSAGVPKCSARRHE